MRGITIVLVTLALGGLTGASSIWKDITRETFTEEHNWMIVRAHLRNPSDLLRLLAKKPRNPTELITISETVFTLYTRTGPAEGVRIFVGDVASLTQGKFNSGKTTVFATHGFLSGATTDWMIQMKTAELSVEDVNFISIDWSSCAGNILYPTAVDCTKTVGGFLAEMIMFLQGQGANAKAMHLMGHSLGAHLMGQISQHGIRVGRITGWDPAGPLFSDDDTASRIDPSDADVVDVIHTDMFLFGYYGVLGHYDFYPNGGNNQPGCFLLDELCNHSMSYYYYIQSLYYKSKYPAVQCNSIKDAEGGNCQGNTAYMGFNSIQSNPGLYYLQVDEAATGDP